MLKTRIDRECLCRADEGKVGSGRRRQDGVALQMMTSTNHESGGRQAARIYDACKHCDRVLSWSVDQLRHSLIIVCLIKLALEGRNHRILTHSSIRRRSHIYSVDTGPRADTTHAMTRPEPFVSHPRPVSRAALKNRRLTKSQLQRVGVRVSRHATKKRRHVWIRTSYACYNAI